MTDSTRAAFEAWAYGIEGLRPDVKFGDEYDLSLTAMAWAAYQAARQSALEEAVLACESIARNWVDTGATPADCAEAIRQLAAEAGNPQGEKT